MPQHTFAVSSGRRCVLRSGRTLSSHRIRGSRHSFRPQHRRSSTEGRLVDQQQTAGELAGLQPGCLIPRHRDSPQEPEPAQQIHAVGTLSRCRPAAGLQIPQILRDGLDDGAGVIKQPVRLPWIVRGQQLPTAGTTTAARSRRGSSCPSTEEDGSRTNLNLSCELEKSLR